MIDLRALRFPLITLLLVAAIGAGSVYFTQGSLEAAKRKLAQQQQQLRDARTRLQRSGEEKQLIVQYVDRYQYLQRLGFVGEEQRINWLDGLRLANEQTQLFGIRYQIGAQQPYPYATELDPGRLVLRQSLMKIEFNALHEGDLLRFLSALAKEGAGVFSVNQCTLDRIPASGGVRFEPNLHVACELAWLTIKPGTEDKKS